MRKVIHYEDGSVCRVPENGKPKNPLPIYVCANCHKMSHDQYSVKLDGKGFCCSKCFRFAEREKHALELKGAKK